MRQLDGRRTVMAGVWDSRIKKELVAADDGIASQVAEALQNDSRQLIGSRSANYIRVINANENHERLPEAKVFGFRLLAAQAKKAQGADQAGNSTAYCVGEDRLRPPRVERTHARQVES